MSCSFFFYITCGGNWLDIVIMNNEWLALRIKERIRIRRWIPSTQTMSRNISRRSQPMGWLWLIAVTIEGCGWLCELVSIPSTHVCPTGYSCKYTLVQMNVFYNKTYLIINFYWCLQISMIFFFFLMLLLFLSSIKNVDILHIFIFSFKHYWKVLLLRAKIFRRISKYKDVYKIEYNHY